MKQLSPLEAAMEAAKNKTQIKVGLKGEEADNHQLEKKQESESIKLAIKQEKEDKMKNWNYFPEKDSSWIVPLDNQVVLQVAHTEVSPFIEHIPSEIKADQLSNRVAKVISMGQSAYKDKNTLEDWDGYDVKVGDFILLPETAIASTFFIDHVLFCVVADVHVKAKINNVAVAVSHLKKLY